MILNRQRGVRVAAAGLAQFLRRAERLLRLPPQTVTVCLVSDAAIARMNLRFRGRRGPTDVLSFPAGGDGRRRRPPVALLSKVGFYLGDIAIAPGVARRNARRAGRALDEELRLLVLHGLLHLMGYDHSSDHGEMERRERALRRSLELN